MAYRTLADVAAQTQDLLLPGLVQKYLTTNETLAWMTTLAIDRPSISVNRVASYGAVQKGIDCNTSLTSVAISASNEVFNLVQYARQYEVCNQVTGLASTFVDQAGEELLGAIKAMAEEVGVDAINGSGSGEIKGLESLITNSVAASTVGGSGDVEAIWSLFDSVKAKSSKMALMANAKTKRRIMSALLASATVGTSELKGTSFMVPNFNGASILTNDTIADGSIYLANGDPQEGLFMAVGEHPGNNIGGLFRFVDVGINQSKDTRINRVFGSFAQILKSNDAIAAVTGW
jgi:hypothetical protein